MKSRKIATTYRQILNDEIKVKDEEGRVVEDTPDYIAANWALSNILHYTFEKHSIEGNLYRSFYEERVNACYLLRNLIWHVLNLKNESNGTCFFSILGEHWPKGGWISVLLTDIFDPHATKFLRDLSFNKDSLYLDDPAFRNALERKEWPFVSSLANYNF